MSFSAPDPGPDSNTEEPSAQGSFPPGSSGGRDAVPEPGAGAWSERWSRLVRPLGVRDEERLLVALSGGADSVLLLRLAAGARPRPRLRALHVDHGLRGEEARADARFCAELCHRLDVPLRTVRLDLPPDAASWEARARELRYQALVAEAERTGHRTIVTGHHADDVLETLLLRWTRGTRLEGLQGPRARVELRPGSFGGRADAPPVVLVRPLSGLRREEIRRLLFELGQEHREDASNADPRFARARVRHGLVPALRRHVGEEGLRHLQEFAESVERLERSFARATAHVAWEPAPYASAGRGRDAELGGVVARKELMRLALPLRRRVVWRLVLEGTGRAPGRGLLEGVLEDLSRGRCRRHSLPRGFALLLRSDRLQLVPPTRSRRADDPGQLFLPFPEEIPLRPEPSLSLAVPGTITLPDGRRLSAEVVEPEPPLSPPSDPTAVELDARGLPHRLAVRWPRDGDRFHALGAPGSKRLTRFLADRGIPREDRRSVPLVFAGEELIWVSGVEPAESRRIRPGTRRRLRLTLHPASA